MLNQDYPINYGQYKQGLLKTVHFSCREAKSRVNGRSSAAVDEESSHDGVMMTPDMGTTGRGVEPSWFQLAHSEFWRECRMFWQTCLRGFQFFTFSTRYAKKKNIKHQTESAVSVFVMLPSHVGCVKNKSVSVGVEVCESGSDLKLTYSPFFWTRLLFTF